MLRSNLKPILDQREMSIRELSRRVDHRFDSVRMLYNDDMERYPRDLLAKVCRELNIGIAELLIVNIIK